MPTNKEPTWEDVQKEMRHMESESGQLGDTQQIKEPRKLSPMEVYKEYSSIYDSIVNDEIENIIKDNRYPHLIGKKGWMNKYKKSALKGVKVTVDDVNLSKEDYIKGVRDWINSDLSAMEAQEAAYQYTHKLPATGGVRG